MKPISCMLPNGMRVAVSEIPTTRLAAIALFSIGGARAEKESEVGIAHYFEHLLFRGGAKYQEESTVNQMIEELGGSSNAFTGREFVVCFIHTFREYMEEMFDLLADIWFRTRLDVHDIEIERGPILQERASSLDDPNEVMLELYRAFLWGGQHPLGRSILGSKDDIERFCREDFVSYHERLFGPANTVLSIAGGISALDMFKLAHRYFGGAVAVRDPSPVFPKVAENPARTAFRESDTEQVRGMLGYIPDPLLSYSMTTSRDRAAFNLLMSILGGSPSSRLFENVRTKRGLVYTVSSQPEIYYDYGTFMVYFAADARNVPYTLELILAEMERLLRDGVTERELAKAKLAKRRAIEEANESSLHIAMELGEITARGIDFVDSESYFKMFVEPIDMDDLAVLAKRYLRREWFRFAALGPLGVYAKDIETIFS